MQGEADAYDATMAATYQTNLINFIGQQRSDFSSYGGTNMQFAIGRIIQDWPTPEGNALVRAAQEAVPGVAGVGPASWINTDDLELSTTLTPHYGTQGQIDLGVRFANVFIPEPSGFALLSAGLFGLFGYVWRKRKCVGQGRSEASHVSKPGIVMLSYGLAEQRFVDRLT